MVAATPRAVRVLAVADEVVAALWQPSVRRHAADVVFACGDLPFDYLSYLGDTLDAPLAYVPGNHDPDLSGVRQLRSGLALRAGLPATAPGPLGGVNVDGRIATIAGLRVGGLGGSLRYRPGPNQYTQGEQRRRAAWLSARARWPSHHPGLDVVLSHAPPLGCGDGDDLPHVGFAALHSLVAATRPAYLLHGHLHPYGVRWADRQLGPTTVINVVGYRLLAVTPRGRASR